MAGRPFSTSLSHSRPLATLFERVGKSLREPMMVVQWGNPAVFFADEVDATADGIRDQDG